MDKVKIELERADAKALIDLLNRMNYHTTAAIITLSSGDEIITDEDIELANKAVYHTAYRLLEALEK